jgi:outer membrane protein TolC
MKKIFFLTFIFLFSNFVFSLTLEEAVKMALKHSEEIEIIRQNKKINLEKAKQVSSFVFPQISTNAEYSEFETNEEENPYYPFQDRTYKAGISLSQLLWSGGKISGSLELEKNLIKLSDFQEIDEKSYLIKQVSEAFIDVLYQRAILNILEDRVRQRKVEFDDAKDLYDVGMVTHLDVREAELNLNSSNNDLIEGKTNYYSSLVNLNLLLGNNDLSNLYIPEGNLERNKNILSNIKLFEDYVKSEKQRILKMTKLNIRTIKNKIKITKSEYLPSFVFVTSGQTEGEKTEEMDESWQIGIRLEWNIFNGGNTSSKKRRYHAEYIKYLTEFKKKKRDLLGTINKINKQIIDIDKQIELQKKSLRFAEQNYIDAKDLYNSGQITLTRLEIFNLKLAEARFGLVKLYYLENKINLGIEAYLR